MEKLQTGRTGEGTRVVNSVNELIDDYKKGSEWLTAPDLNTYTTAQQTVFRVIKDIWFDEATFPAGLINNVYQIRRLETTGNYRLLLNDVTDPSSIIAESINMVNRYENKLQLYKLPMTFGADTFFIFCLMDYSLIASGSDIDLSDNFPNLFNFTVKFQPSDFAFNYFNSIGEFSKKEFLKSGFDEFNASDLEKQLLRGLIDFWVDHTVDMDKEIINHGAVTGTFTAGETVTGGSSGATGTIEVVNTDNIIIERTSSSEFDLDEAITTAGGSAATTNAAKATSTDSEFIGNDEIRMRFVFDDKTAPTNDRFGLYNETRTENITISNPNISSWDKSSKKLQWIRNEYRGSILNFLFDPYKIDVSGDTLDSGLHRLKVESEPNTAIGYEYLRKPELFDAEKSQLARNYPDALNKASDFKSIFFGQSNDCEIVLVGDSLTGRQESYTQLSANELKTSPVWLGSKNWAYHFYQKFIVNKPDFHRFDSDDFFTEVGTFENDTAIFGQTAVGQWLGNIDVGEGNRSRYTESVDATVAFDWNLANHEKCNFIHDLDFRATSNIDVSVSGGNGRIQVHNGATWLEANGYSFSQYIDDTVATQGSGNMPVVNKVRLKFRRVAISGTDTVTFDKGNNSDYFFYWGVEMWNGITTHIHNRGNPGAASNDLAKFSKDLTYYNPDLILLQLPLVNDMSAFATAQTGLDGTQDLVWGDRAGNLNANSYANIYPNTSIIGIIPHVNGYYWSGDQVVLDHGNTMDDVTGWGYAQRSKQLFEAHSDYGYIDVLGEMIKIGKLNGWTIAKSFGISSNFEKSSFVIDTVHTNDYGAEIWAKILLSNLL
jgi:hypothetical protein